MKFSIAWMLATWVGWVAGIAFILFLSGACEAIGILHTQFIVGAGMGGGVGIVQWWLLKRRFNFNFNWVWASVAGGCVPFLIYDVLRSIGAIGMVADSVLYCGIVAGLLTSTLQYIVLSRRSNLAIIWMPVCTAGWLISAASVIGVNYTTHLSKNLLVLFSLNLGLILSGGVILGCVTVWALVLITGQEK